MKLKIAKEWQHWSHIFEGQGKLTLKGMYEAMVYISMGYGALAIWSLGSTVLADTIIDKLYAPEAVMQKADPRDTSQLGRFSDKFHACVDDIKSDNFNVYVIRMDSCWNDEVQRRGW